MGAAPVPLDGRGPPELLTGRPEHDKARQAFGHNRYVELII